MPKKAGGKKKKKKKIKAPPEPEPPHPETPATVKEEDPEPEESEEDYGDDDDESVDSEADSVISVDEAPYEGEDRDPTATAVKRMRPTNKIVFDSGDVYEGEVLEGLRHGQGSYTWLYGGRYVGGWVQSYQHGTGKRTYPNGDSYEGEWKLDRRDGTGTMLYAGSGVRYEGEWCDDKPHGNGTEISPDGCSYTGEWNAGRKTGVGRAVYGSGDVYVGMHLDGRRHGYGTLTYKDDADGSWDGQWVGGLRHGRGVLLRAPQDTLLRQAEIVGWAVLLCAEAGPMEMEINLQEPPPPEPEPELDVDGNPIERLEEGEEDDQEGESDEDEEDEEDEVEPKLTWTELIERAVEGGTREPIATASATASERAKSSRVGSIASSRGGGGGASAGALSMVATGDSGGMFAEGSIAVGLPGGASYREGSPLPHGGGANRPAAMTAESQAASAAAAGTRPGTAATVSSQSDGDG
eukprot:SAG22_NODE_3303_length_1792_cov_3.291199_1_plen_464_part_01